MGDAMKQGHAMRRRAGVTSNTADMAQGTLFGEPKTEKSYDIREDGSSVVRKKTTWAKGGY